MRLAAVFLALALVVGCGAPGSGGGGGATATADEAKQTLLAARLADVRGGGSFRLKDFGGKVVIVVGMAVW